MLAGIHLEPITPLDVGLHSEIQCIAHLEAKVILAPCQRYGRYGSGIIVDFNKRKYATGKTFSDIRKSERTGDFTENLYLHAKHFVELGNEGIIVRISS